MILIDTNVLIDVLEDDPQWAEWSVAQLRAHSKIHELGINAIVYAELSLAFERLEELDDAVMRLGLKLLEIPRPALFLAGRAFLTAIAVVLDLRGSRRPSCSTRSPRSL